jgi:hypothetical protein
VSTRSQFMIIVTEEHSDCSSRRNGLQLFGTTMTPLLPSSIAFSAPISVTLYTTKRTSLSARRPFRLLLATRSLPGIITTWDASARFSSTTRKRMQICSRRFDGRRQQRSRPASIRLSISSASWSSCSWVTFPTAVSSVSRFCRKP